MSNVTFIPEQVSVYIDDKYVGYIEIEDCKPQFCPDDEVLDFDAIDKIREKLGEMGSNG